MKSKVLRYARKKTSACRVHSKLSSKSPKTATRMIGFVVANSNPYSVVTSLRRGRSDRKPVGAPLCCCCCRRRRHTSSAQFAGRRRRPLFRFRSIGRATVMLTIGQSRLMNIDGPAVDHYSAQSFLFSWDSRSDDLVFLHVGVCRVPLSRQRPDANLPGPDIRYRSKITT